VELVSVHVEDGILIGWSRKMRHIVSVIDQLIHGFIFFNKILYTFNDNAQK
jgi:hypothetical protein